MSLIFTLPNIPFYFVRIINKICFELKLLTKYWGLSFCIQNFNINWHRLFFNVLCKCKLFKVIFLKVSCKYMGMNKTCGTWGQHLCKILNLYLGLGFWHPGTQFGLFSSFTSSRHPQKPFVCNCSCISHTGNISWLLENTLWMNSVFVSCSLCCLPDLNSKRWSGHDHANFGWGHLEKA